MIKKHKIKIDSIAVQNFLWESNAIEGVHDAISMEQAIYAWKYLIKQDVLTPHVILHTHKILMLKSNLMPTEKGYFRNVMVWVGGRPGINALKIREAIDSWCADVAVSVEIPGLDGKHIQLDHVTYEKIHPFMDGNGRMFMNWQRIKAGFPILVIKADERQEYYKWFH